jgi:hypothetical protein
MKQPTLSTRLRRSVLLKWLVPGTCGALAHSLLMYLKARLGWLPAFSPYERLQAALSALSGSDVSPIVPWALSFVSGATVLGFLFARVYRYLPGASGVVKGAAFAVLAWVLMNLLLFPAIGLGFFGLAAGLGAAASLFSLAVLLVYSIVAGVAYAMMQADD